MNIASFPAGPAAGVLHFAHGLFPDIRHHRRHLGKSINLRPQHGAGDWAKHGPNGIGDTHWFTSTNIELHLITYVFICVCTDYRVKEETSMQ